MMPHFWHLYCLATSQSSIGGIEYVLAYHHSFVLFFCLVGTNLNWFGRAAKNECHSAADLALCSFYVLVSKYSNWIF
jgi:hypothetical protein